MERQEYIHGKFQGETKFQVGINSDQTIAVVDKLDIWTLSLDDPNPPGNQINMVIGFNWARILMAKRPMKTSDQGLVILRWFDHCRQSKGKW